MSEASSCLDQAMGSLTVSVGRMPGHLHQLARLSALKLGTAG